MGYNFKTDINEKEYMNFVSSLPHYNVTQTPMWAKVKTGWVSTLCALYEDGKIAGAAMLLIRKLGPGMKIIYSPRGFLIDYENKELLKVFNEGILSYAKKTGAYLIRIDPEIKLSDMYKKETEKLDEGFRRLENLTGAGYKHMGFARDFHSYTQPRFNAEYYLSNENGPISDEEILAGFDKKLKKFIGRYTEDRGIHFEAKTGSENAEEFFKISEHTEQRQHILLRDLEYFKRISEAFGEDCVFFFSKINLKKFINFCKEQIKKDTNAEQAEKDLKTAERLSENFEEVVLSALLTIKSQDTAYLMYSGFNDSVFPRFRTTNQIRYEAMKYFRDNGCKTFSFMGINGDLNDSLSEFKLKFNPHIVEFAGEFEYPVKKTTYKIMNKAFPVLKKIYIRTMLIFKGKK